MSKAVRGFLFGSPSKSSQSNTNLTGYESISPQAQATYDRALQGANTLTAQDFTNAPINADQQAAADFFRTPTNFLSPEEFRSGISLFSNPFEEQVIQNTIRDLSTEAQGGYRDIASYASDIGGYGSNRRGLLEAELQKNLLKTVGDISAQSRAANFENAATRTLNEINKVRDINTNKALSLFDIGSMFQQQETQNKQAGANLYSYLTDLATSLAKGGGGGSGVSTGPTTGFINSLLGKAASAAGAVAGGGAAG